jgi:hypothetical protein
VIRGLADLIEQAEAAGGPRAWSVEERLESPDWDRSRNALLPADQFAARLRRRVAFRIEVPAAPPP